MTKSIDKNIYTNTIDEHLMQDGLVAIGGDLSAKRLISAYKNGMFPWYDNGHDKDFPILWWSPNPRCIMYPHNLKISHSLKKSIKKNSFGIVCDKDFPNVIQKCSQTKRKNQNGTWINDDMIDAYTELYKIGYAHSFESYYDGKLAGGLYGVNIGDVFFGESMFCTKTDASKVAFAYSVEFFKYIDIKLIDCQMSTSHLFSLGACEIKKKDFLRQLEVLTKNKKDNNWHNLFEAIKSQLFNNLCK